ncbi:MAG: DUF1926 domain-containing protein [Chitinivibrionales bacterium]|nr:DUF1926 domain-containing protein [Chitinivibrionales bacterium]MBD3394941.1 DUF1926 domain-containing protein [Chitinivibrionales bacterium]
MKRHALAILVHPYKNVLIPQDRLRQAVNGFFGKVVEIATAYPSLRLNLVLPGYMLPFADPLLLSQLREVQKRDCLECLTPGYTEPFLSFSPKWLSGANLRAGIEVFEELLSSRPTGFAPAFSNWEPSNIDTLIECGMQYVTLSRAVLPHESQDLCGYWVTEHTGATIAVFPTHVMHHYTAPGNVLDWIEGTMRRDADDASATKLVTIDYLVPLVPDEGIDPYGWLVTCARAADSLLHKYQVVRLGEFPGLAYPLGLQYIPPELMLRRDDEETNPHFSNYLHTFEQAGIIQRKMMDIADRLAPTRDTKDTVPLVKQLFFCQDINRLIPGKAGGFNHLHDRLWSYAKMIDIESQLHKRERIQGGQIRIADMLRNGTKSLVLTNRPLKVCIDHRNGGQVFELDYRERAINLCAGFNPETHRPPRIIVAGKSHTSFIDHFLESDCQRADFMAQASGFKDDFTQAQFEYKVKKTTTGVRAVLSRQCAVSVDGKNYPLAVEKAFGLEGDTPGLSFVYQLSNTSLTSYAFRFAVELTFTLPGAASNNARIVCGNDIDKSLARGSFSLDNISAWSIQDTLIGAEVQFVLQKPVDVWVFPARRLSRTDTGYQGTTFVLSSGVSLGENAVWSLMGKMVCKKGRAKEGLFDAI